MISSLALIQFPVWEKSEELERRNEPTFCNTLAISHRNFSNELYTTILREQYKKIMFAQKHTVPPTILPNGYQARSSNQFKKL